MRNVMPNYTKLFSTIVTSTIWQEPDRTRIVWITMLALSDKNGEIHASIPGLARVAGVPTADCEAAINAFLSPDSYSRTPEHEGRRIAKIDGGWELLNFQKYRLLASTADTLAKNATRQKRFRDRNGKVTDSNASVTPSNGDVTPDGLKAEAEADSKAEAEAKTDSNAKTNPPPKPPAVRGVGDRLPTSETAKRIATIFKRRHTTAWNEKEIAAFKALGEIDLDDLTLLERYYASPAPYLRHDLGTFLNNFAGEIDRAKKLPPEKQAQAAHQAPLGKWGV